MKKPPNNETCSQAVSESELVRLLTQMLRDEGYRVRLEVSNMGQSVDLVATQGRWVTAIEAKLSDWRRALVQCRTHESVADYVCVAIGSLSVPSGLFKAAHELGYGVLHFKRTEAKFKWEVRPRLNSKLWKPQRRYWSRALRRVPYAY